MGERTAAGSAAPAAGETSRLRTEQVQATPAPSAGIRRRLDGSFPYLEQLRPELERARLLRLGVITVEFALVVAAIRVLNIESKAFELVLTLAFGGFLVHHFLPSAWRQNFFAALSVGSVLLVFGWQAGGWLLGMGGLLILLCHLPVRLWARITLLLLTAAAMTAARAGALPWIASGIPAIIWPILGSMFMFRLMVYLYDLKHKAAPFSAGRALSYFFMLPNVCFPLFPIVDYKTFQRSAYNKDALRLYQTGVRFMLRGLVHLMLYKIVYFMGVVEVGQVTSGASAAQYMITAYLLYLQISGLFHLIVGILHMYGFGLAATHHLWLLASSFTDLWRRANIYWRDFVQKLMFNPAYLALRRGRSETWAIAQATLIVAVATWFLHSYQWFWIRGNFPFSWADILFWTGLGLGLTVNTIMESRKARVRTLEKRTRRLGENVALCLKTAGMFTSIVVLWTIWNTPEIEELQIVWNALLNSGPRDVAVLAGVPLGLGLVRVLFDDYKRDGTPDAPVRPFWREAAVVSVLASAFIVVALRPILLAPISPSLATLVSDVREQRLNAADTKKLQRGYYEELADVNRFNNELWVMYGGRPKDWTESIQTRQRTDAIQFEYVPSTAEVFKGEMRTINSLGMRDREYTRERGAATFRIALVGVSIEAGSGVKDNETYENLVEDRLNLVLGPRTGKTFEILNFSHGGYSATQKLALIEQRVFDFHPDVILYVAHSTELEWTFSSAQHLIRYQLLDQFPFVQTALDRARIKVEAGKPPPEKIVLESKLAPYAEDALRAVLDRFREGALSRGIRPIMLISENLDHGAERPPAYDRLVRLGQSAKLLVLDMQGAFSGTKDRKSLWITPYDSHPNALGHRLLADRLYELLLKEQVVPSEASPRPAGPSGQASGR